MALLDLVLRRHCVNCGRVDWSLCPTCRRQLHDSVHCRWVPGSLTSTVSAAPYEGVVRSVVLAAKRSGQQTHVTALAYLAGLALRFLIEELEPQTTLLVIPVRSGATTRRSAGRDLVSAVLRTAIHDARDPPLPVAVANVLEMRPVRANQKELNRRERQLNMLDRFRVRPDERLVGRPVVLFDDVTTSGATLNSAAAAVRASGALVSGAAVVAHRSSLNTG